MMSDERLNEAALALLERPVIAHLGTVGADGTPHVTPVWIDVDGGDVIINAVDTRAKTANMRRSGKVALSVVDPDDPYRVVALQGTVTDIDGDGADDDIRRLARKYLGADTYPGRPAHERRVKITIRTDRVLMQPPAG